MSRLDRANRLRHETVLAVSLFRIGRLERLIDLWKQHDRRNAKRMSLARLAHQALQGPTRHAGHRLDRDILGILVKEQRQDEIRNLEGRLAHHRADGGAAAVAAWALHRMAWMVKWFCKKTIIRRLPRHWPQRSRANG